MNLKLKEFVASSGAIILYSGHPDLQKLDELAAGPGDLWHSSFEQGFKNAFPEIVYFSVVFFWYVNDFDHLDQCVSWRINPENFSIRKEVWDLLGGFDAVFTANPSLQAMDFGYNLLKNSGGIALYVKGLYTDSANSLQKISTRDRHLFYRKNFKVDHAIYMNLRRGFWKISEWNALAWAVKNFNTRTRYPVIPPRNLKPIIGQPSVSYIIPTMMRQEFTLALLEDLKKQTYLPSQVIVVDATPRELRNESLYGNREYPFEIHLQWQETKGSCRARNEAITVCNGDYIVFGDDDIRIPPDFIENHIRLLQTYDAGACNGLDIRADNQQQDLEDLERKLEELGAKRWKSGVALNFSNANSCVKKGHVAQLIGNDINFDGGYGEDSDFGLSLVKSGVMVLANPFAVNLHLKPALGGYRFWGIQAKAKGKERKKQPWEGDHPVGWIRPVPSPTVIYGTLKQFKPEQVREYRYKYFFLYLFKGPKAQFFLKLLRLPYRICQFNRSVFYADKLIKRGRRYK